MSSHVLQKALPSTVIHFDLRMVRDFQKNSWDGSLLPKSVEARLRIHSARTPSMSRTLDHVQKTCAC